MSHILIVDDEPSIAWALEQALNDDGHDVFSTASAESAFDHLTERSPDVIVMDVRLPGLDGITALHRLRESGQTAPIIIMTAFGNLDTAVDSIAHGAFEYLTKPFDLDDAIHSIQRAIESNERLADHTSNSSGRDEDSNFIGSSPAIQAIFRKIAYVANYDVPVLITGESGTGKELVASALHQYSNRSDNPFVPICIPAMSDSTVESELFGHTKGAFTGAISDREGLLRAADGGTAFFDEIGEIQLTTQVKLLRVLETKQVMPVGGDVGRQTNFRLVAATNQRLEEMVDQGKFREDLFYRLNAYHIEVPPLRERREDIPKLANHFIHQLDPSGNVSISNEAIGELMSREWQGNIRELRNAIEHAVIVTRAGDIQPHAIPPPSKKTERPHSPSDDLPEAVREWWRSQVEKPREESQLAEMYESFLAEVEPTLLAEALSDANGNRQEAARLLGIHRQTLRDKLKKYEMSEFHR